MDTTRSSEFIRRIMSESPRAFADIRGNEDYPDLRGMGLFYRVDGGTLVFAEFQNLPYIIGSCETEFYGFHIHEGDSCETPGAHLNPNGCVHPAHMGDLISIMGNHGYAWTMFFTDRFLPEDIKRKTIIIHRSPDDFKTQPSGNAGEMIGCGVIQ